MPLRRFRVHTLMLATGAIAFNLAVGRALWNDNPSLLRRVALIGIVLQVGLILLARNPRRPFWVGFVAAGAVTMLSCFYILDSMHLVASTPTREVSVYVYSGSTMYRVWTCCDALLVTPVERFLPEVERWYTSYPVPTLVVVEAASYLIDFLPHLVIAAVAGLVTRFVARRFRSSRWNAARQAEPSQHAFRFRFWMLPVAAGMVAGLLVLAGRTISEKRQAVANYYGDRERQSRGHAEVVEGFAATNSPSAPENREKAARYREQAERYARARRKYQHAANKPWLTVTFDPSDGE